ncbi:MAG TPA: hypothetical protein V6C81_27135 [Planktothrix sp.]|jgi:hypothetical protein
MFILHFLTQLAHPVYLAFSLTGGAIGAGILALYIKEERLTVPNFWLAPTLICGLIGSLLPAYLFSIPLHGMDSWDGWMAGWTLCCSVVLGPTAAGLYLCFANAVNSVISRFKSSRQLHAVRSEERYSRAS